MDVEKVIDDLLSIKKLGADGSPAHIKIDNAIQTIRELQDQIPKWHLCEDGDLPTRYDDYYLCQLKGARNYGGNIQVCKYRKADRFKEHDYFDHMRNGFPNITAWRELPKFEEVE